MHIHTYIHTNSTKRLVKSRRGMSLIEVTVASGVMGIIALAFVSMITAQQKQIKMMEIKSAMNETSNFMQEAFKDSSNCSNQFLTANNGAFQTLASSIDGVSISNPGVVNLADATTTTSSTAKIYLNRVYLGSTSAAQKAVEVGKPLSGISAGQVKNIYIGEFIRSDAADDTKYIAQLVVNIDMASAGLTQVRPIKLKLNVQTTGGALTSRSLASCTTGETGGGAGSSGTISVFDGTACPAGKTVISKLWTPKTCTVYVNVIQGKGNTTCTTSGGWMSNPGTCLYPVICLGGKPCKYWSYDTCTSDTYTKVMCVN